MQENRESTEKCIGNRIRSSAATHWASWKTSVWDKPRMEKTQKEYWRKKQRDRKKETEGQIGSRKTEVKNCRTTKIRETATDPRAVCPLQTAKLQLVESFYFGYSWSCKNWPVLKWLLLALSPSKTHTLQGKKWKNLHGGSTGFFIPQIGISHSGSHLELCWEKESPQIKLHFPPLTVFTATGLASAVAAVALQTVTFKNLGLLSLKTA